MVNIKGRRLPGKELRVKSLERAKEDLRKAKLKEDIAKKKLADAEYKVKECEAALTEAENMEYAKLVREMNLSLPDLMAMKEKMQAGEVAIGEGGGYENEYN